MTAVVNKAWFEDRWKRKGLTLRKTAQLMGIDPSALSRTLSGEREMKLAEVGKIATVLDVTLNDVLAHMQSDGGPVDDVSSANENDVRISSHSGFGFMRGLIKIEDGFDVAGPFSVEPLDEGYLGEDRL
ncbi:helix-turn-helix domain-containing protein [Mesorhizobium sp. NBSH29]|uniref:helix-turn-helix domain-containing protein n=1 Tax=Mesorhizobium sp. NBSH29 TaxID=2654249 RepID=UPI001896788B|nr:helix-turn-helix transcriptional regulator [Mesorhizobium sp. NBSH29]QPC88451.1 helix-turn-helix domain-containing protein [Mesorhizobium sp. NBSH29]